MPFHACLRERDVMLSAQRRRYRASRLLSNRAQFQKPSEQGAVSVTVIFHAICPVKPKR